MHRHNTSGKRVLMTPHVYYKFEKIKRRRRIRVQRAAILLCISNFYISDL